MLCLGWTRRAIDKILFWCKCSKFCVSSSGPVWTVDSEKSPWGGFSSPYLKDKRSFWSLIRCSSGCWPCWPWQCICVDICVDMCRIYTVDMEEAAHGVCCIPRTRQHPAVMTVSIHQDHLPPARLRRLTWHWHASCRGGQLDIFSLQHFDFHIEKNTCISNHFRPKFVWLKKKGDSSSKFWNTFFFHDCLCFVFVCVQKHYFGKKGQIEDMLLEK